LLEQSAISSRRNTGDGQRVLGGRRGGRARGGDARALGGRGGEQKIDVKFEQLQGFNAPGTPAKYNKVGVIKTGPSDAENVLVLVPGTLRQRRLLRAAGEGHRPSVEGLAGLGDRAPGELPRGSLGAEPGQERQGHPEADVRLLPRLRTDPSITKHFQFIPDADVAFARDWGMKVEVEDMRRVVEQAKKQGGKVVLGGHSLGGSITTAYATWDFNGKPGAKDLSGLVFIDGGSSPTPMNPEQATSQLRALRSGTPWLTFGGIPAPYAGLFNSTGSTGVKIAPNDPSLGYVWPALPANLKPPVPPTNEGQYGYALDVKTSPMGLRAAQAHLGQLEKSGDPRGWDGAGALTPVTRYAEMFSGWGLQSRDGTAWYHRSA
jgi:pimeloyl-ACP methyl ester carboxylesterase